MFVYVWRLYSSGQCESVFGNVFAIVYTDKKQLGKIDAIKATKSGLSVSQALL